MLGHVVPQHSAVQRCPFTAQMGPMWAAWYACRMREQSLLPDPPSALPLSASYLSSYSSQLHQPYQPEHA